MAFLNLKSFGNLADNELFGFLLRMKNFNRKFLGFGKRQFARLNFVPPAFFAGRVQRSQQQFAFFRRLRSF